ncbi:hypothetical protein ACFVFI_37265 [Streptomyces sp. NPDC057705]|uniref:hypothetical protein n=1 Tax=Streptomyces sp. NPDC057705 TaxID=3346222 RepID=UPI0036BBFE1D
MTTDLAKAREWLESWTDRSGVEGIPIKPLNSCYLTGHRGWTKIRRRRPDAPPFSSMPRQASEAACWSSNGPSGGSTLSRRSSRPETRWKQMSEQQHHSALSSQLTNEQIIDWLIEECRDVGNRVMTLTTYGDRILATGSTVIALAATVAIGGGKSYFLMWLPLGISVVVVHALYLNYVIKVMIGYKRGLESEIQRRAGLPLIAFNSRILRGGSGRRVGGMLFMGAAVYLAAMGVGLVQAFHTLSPGAWGYERAWLYIALTIASVAVGLCVNGYFLWTQRGASSIAEQKVAHMFS